MALNVKKVKLDLHRYFGHELDLIIKNHPFLDYNHGSRLCNIIALQDPRTMEECFDADLLSKVSNALQNRRSSTSRQTELENNTTNNNRQEQNNLPDSENVSVVVSSSSSGEENIVKSDKISAAKTDNNNVTPITSEITNDSVELKSQILTSANDENKVENSSSPSPETSDKEDKSNEMKTLNSENTIETETTVKPTDSKNDDHSDEKSDSNETRLDSDDQEEGEEEEEDEEDKIGKKIRYCVCEKKYDSSNSALCDRCSNLYHVQCAGDETAKNAFKNRKNSRESFPFVCFKCRRNTQLIKRYESELKASGRWDSDCEEALSDENEKNDSSGDDVFLLSEHEGTSATKPSMVRKSRTVSAEKRKSVEESVDWIKSKCKEPNQTKLVSNLADKRKITRTKHVSISKAAENLSKKVSSLQQQTQLQKAALKSNSHGSIDSIKQMRRGSKSSINSQQTTTTKPVLQTQTSLSQSSEEKLVSLLQSDFEKRLSGDTSETGTHRLSETELRSLCQSIYNEYKKHFADISMSKFHMKMTSLRSNLSDVKNKTFYRKILNGSIVPSKLPEMSSADMMDDSLKDEEKRQEEAKLRMIIDQNVEHNVALLRHISEVNEKLGFSKLAGIDCDQETLLQTATTTRRDSLEKKQQPSENQITDEVANTVSAAPIEHSNRRKLNSKLEELSEKIAEEIVVKSTAEKEKDKLAVDLTLKRATSIQTSPSLEKVSESGAAISTKTDESAKKISSPQISSTASAQVKPTQSVQKPEEAKTTPTNIETPTKSIEIAKKPVVPSLTTQPVQIENNPSKISAPLRQTSITTSSSKSPSPNINNTESVSVTKPPLEISSTNKTPVVKPPETLAIAKPIQIAESKQTPSPSDPSNSPTIKLAAPLLINRSLSSQSANVSPSQVQQSSPAPEDELLAKLPPPPPPPPVQFIEYRLKVFIELEKSFCVSTQWRNVIETGNKKKEKAFTHTPTIANYLMKHRKVNLRPRDGVRDPNVERIWPVLSEREAYVVFEVRPSGERESYQWLNNQYKSELTSDEVIFGTLKDAVEFAIAPHLSVPSKPVKCVRCFVPNELASIVEHVYLVWVAEKKGKDLQENYRIPLDREQSRILCLMFIKTSSSTSVISPLATTTSTSSALLSRSTSTDAGIKRKVSTPITPSPTTPSIPEAPQTTESVESKKPKVDQPQPKAVLRDPRLIRPNETTPATNTPSVFEALKRLFRDIQAGKTEALTSVESLASDVDKLSDAEKLELRNEFQKFDSLKSLVGRLYDRGSEDMDVCSPEPEKAQVVSVSSEPSKDEQSKINVEKDDEKKAPAASLNDADLLIQQLKTAPTNKKITVHLPKSIKENPKELVKFYEFVNDNENWRLTENYFTVEKPASISAEGGGDETAETRSKSLSDDDWSDTEAFRPQETAENRSRSRDRCRHSNERDSRRDSWHTSRSNNSRSRSRSRVKLFSDRDSYSARGLADRFRGRGRGGPALFRGRGRGRGGAPYYKPDRYNKDRYRK